MRVYTADKNKLKDKVLQKMPLNFVILNWNTETYANIPSHIFQGVVFKGHETLITLISGRDLKMSILMPPIKFYRFFSQPHLVFSLTICLQTSKLSFSAEANSQYILLSQIR